MSSLLFSQDYDQQQIRSQRSKLERIREEIDNYRNMIAMEQQKEKKIVDRLAQLERELDLTQKLITELKNEERQKLKTVDRVSREIETKQAELRRLKENYKKRIVNVYKYGRVRDIELLLSAKSFNQALIWFKYLKLLSQNDQRNYENILAKKQRIESQNHKLKMELIAKRKLLNEKRKESENLASIGIERNELLTTVQQNKKLYLEKLAQYENSAKKIQRLIIAEERKRLTLEDQGVVKISDFPKLKGRMIWPTNGFIVNKFGVHKHPKWKTVTENIGIDIKAEFGEEVRVVAKGVVTAITWQRGRGNIVIINHLGGYFTVYTHLSQILVQIDEQINTGQIIGRVGDTGSLSGPMLHFEIWKSNEVLNPEEWLS